MVLIDYNKIQVLKDETGTHLVAFFLEWRFQVAKQVFLLQDVRLLQRHILLEIGRKLER